MATVTGPVKQSPNAKYDAIVEGQLERARKRIRTLDLMTALLGFIAGTLAYGAVMALLDNALTLPPAALYAGFFVYLTAALVYLGVTVVRPLTQHINPYFAARQVEQTLPGAKNSVVNWLDLHDEELPPAVQSALSQKAAKDLAKADLEKAVSGRRAGWAGGIVAGLVFVLLVLIFSFGGGKLFKHLGRAFLPFNGAAPPTKTQLVLLEPEDGNVTVAVNEPVTIRVRVDGQVPESLKLLTRPAESDPEQERWLDPDGSKEWSITVPPFEVKQGFFYRVVGGDASTDVYRVDVRSTPLIVLDRFTATYRQRPYIGNPVERVQRGVRELNDFRGTEVTLYVPTNRRIKEGQLDLFAKDGQHLTYKATLVAGDEKAMRIAFRLEHSGTYSIRFTSAENDRLPEYTDPLSFKVTADEDLPPTVDLFKPGKDESLAADATLALEGRGTDDIGVKELTLRMKLNETAIESRPYRSDKEIRLPSGDPNVPGGYPHVLDYKASVDLAALKDAKAKPIALKAGQVLEYWLEARDACDFPKQNIAESTHYKVTIEEPRRDEKAKEEERRQADADQKKHQEEQDKKLQKENEERRQKQEERKKANKEQRHDDSKKDEPDKDGREGSPSKKPDDGGRQGTDPNDKKPRENKPGDPADKGNKPGSEKSLEEKRKEEKAQKNLDNLRDKAEKERREREKSDGKGEEEKERGSAKPDQPQDDKKNAEQGKDKSGKESSKGEGKDSPERKPQDKAKEGGKEGNAQKSGEAKDKGAPEQDKKPQGESKDNAAKQGEKQAEGKNDGGRPEQKQADPRGEAKGSKPKDGASSAKGGEKQNKPNQAAGKDKGDGKQAGQEAASKGGGDKNQDAKRSESKDGQQAQKRGDGKGSDQRNAKQQAGQEKDAGGNPMAGQGERSQAKGPPKPEDNKGQQAGAKGEPQQAPRGQAKEKGKDQASAGGAKPAPKQGDPQAADKSNCGEDKPAQKTAEQPGQVSKAKDDRVQGDALKKPADELRRDDVEDLARDLRSDDPQKREQARNKIEDVQRQTQDGEARQAAADALKKDDERQQDLQKASTKSAPKSSQQPDKKGEQCAECKGGGQKDGGKPGAGKDGGTKQDAAKQGDAKGGSPKADGDKNNVAKHGDDDKEPPSENGLKKWLDKAAKGMQKKDGDPKPNDKQVAEQLAKTIQDLQSNDPKRREQAKEFLKELGRNAKAKKDGGDKEPKGPPQKPVPEDLKKEVEKLAKDLKSNDPKRREQAEDTFKELSKFGRGDKYTGATAEQTERPGDVPEASHTDGRHRNRAGDLQLEKLDPKKLRKLIKDAGLTEKEAREAIEYQRKIEAAKGDPSQAKLGSGKALPTTSPDRFKPGDNKGPPIDSTNEGLPPVELRPAVKDLAKRLSELEKGSKDK
ncbi:MAG: hypothetical protein HYS12_13575 [Planctomycetes bacterium]|nr:hypothetical protein [Planctomycetota bacterium]